MEEDTTEDNRKSGFLCCPFCGLKIPRSIVLGYYAGYCPACGCKMIENELLPYVHNSNVIIKNDSETNMRRINRLDTINSTECLKKEKAQDDTLLNIYGDDNNNNLQNTNTEKELIESIVVNDNDCLSYFIRATLKVKIGDIEGARKDFKMSEICYSKNNFEFEEYPLV